MNAAEQAIAAARLGLALEQAGIRIERVQNDATRIGRTKHALEPVQPAILIGAWLSKGYVVTLEDRAAVWQLEEP